MLKTVLKMMFAAVIAFVLCGGAFVVGSLFQINQNMSTPVSVQALWGLSDKGEDSHVVPEVPDELPNDFYVLLLGVDSDENRENGDEAQYFNGAFRTDTIIVAHVTLSTKKVTLCSLERDIKISIDGEPYKLNAAYLVGGVPMMKEYAEDIMGVSIQYCAAVDMGGLTTIIDSVGGVDVDVEDAFWDEQLQDGLEEGGMQHLDGAQAVMYCRSRYAWLEGDFARGRHQRQVLQALASKVMQKDIVGLFEFANTVTNPDHPLVVTDLPAAQLFELAAKMQGMNPTTDMYSMMTPTITEEGKDGVSYQILNENAWEVMRKQFIYNTDPADAAETLNALGVGNLIDYDPEINGDQLAAPTPEGQENGQLSDLEAAEQAIANGIATDVTNSS